MGYNLQQQILLHRRVNGEVERRDNQGDGLQSSKAESNRGIEKEVVVITRIIKWWRSGTLDKFTGSRIQKFAGKGSPTKIDSLYQIDGST